MYHKIAKAPNIDLILASNENAQMFAILIKKSDKSKFLLLIFFIISRLNCNTAAIEEIKILKSEFNLYPHVFKVSSITKNVFGH